MTMFQFLAVVCLTLSEHDIWTKVLEEPRTGGSPDPLLGRVLHPGPLQGGAHSGEHPAEEFHLEASSQDKLS